MTESKTRTTEAIHANETTFNESDIKSDLIEQILDLKKTVRSYFRHMDKLADGDVWTRVNSDKWTARFEKLEAELKRLSK